MENKYLKYINDLPVMPDVASKVLNLAEFGLDISFKELENIIKMDPGLTIKVLKVANSALYARQKEIKNLQQAITLLGFKNIKSLVLLITASRFFQKAQSTQFYQNFWKHSLITAFLAKSLLAKSKKPEFAETGFIAGLLHNMGKAVLFHAEPDKYLAVVEREYIEQVWAEKIEKEIFGVHHREMGGELFRAWNFPDLFIDVAEEHDSLNITSQSKTVIIYITIAGLLTDSIGYGVVNQEKETLLQNLLPHTTLSGQDLDYYKKHFLHSLKNDTLFSECQELFGITESIQPVQ